jgi:hypothetical protein
MSPTRREFLRVGATALSTSAIAVSLAEGAPPTIECLDYGRSYVCGTAAFNAVRFRVESRTTIIDKAGAATVYYQCASCKSENTFAKRDLFPKDNYDFLPILGEGLWLIFRRPARLSETYRQVRKVEEVWGVPRMKLQAADEVTLLDTWEKIRDATAAGVPLVTQTELADEKTGLRAVIECPTKTMNISLDKKMYQVDTGPIAYPDLAKPYKPQINCLSLAFVAFNAPHFADFVVEQPTPVIEKGQERCKIYHYSSPFSLPAKNTVLGLGKI